MDRTASALLELDATAPATLILSIAIADTSASESLEVTQAGRSLNPVEVLGQHGARLHVVDVESGPVVVTYSVTKSGALPVSESTKPVLRIGHSRADRTSRIRRPGRPATARRRQLMGWPESVLRSGIQPANRWRCRHTALASRGLSRLCASCRRTATRLGCPRPACLGLRTRTRSHGLPRRGRSRG
jgi:hypothetical protein